MMFDHRKFCVGNSSRALSDEDYWDADESEQNLNDGEPGRPEEMVKLNVPLTLNETTDKSGNLVQMDHVKLEDHQLGLPALNKGSPGAPSGQSYADERQRAHSEPLGSDTPGCSNDCGCWECDIEIIQVKEVQKEIKICKCTGVAEPCKCKPTTAGCMQLAERYSDVLELHDKGTQQFNMTSSSRCPLFYFMAFLLLLIILLASFWSLSNRDRKYTLFNCSSDVKITVQFQCSI